MVFKISSENIEEFIEEQHAIDGMISIHDFELWLEEQPKVGEWTPCSERLPNNDEHDWVLAQVQEDNGFMWIPKVMEYRQSKDDWYLEGTGWLKDVYSDAFKVIAWMPLPPAYKEGE